MSGGEQEDNDWAVQAEAKRNRVKERAYLKPKGKAKAKAKADKTDSDSTEAERDIHQPKGPKRKRNSGSKMTVTPHKKKTRGKDTEPEMMLDSGLMSGTSASTSQRSTRRY